MRTTDFLGNEFVVGAKVVYAKTVSRSAALALGEIIELVPFNEDSYTDTWAKKTYPFKLKVLPLGDAYPMYHGRDPLSERYSTTSYYPDAPIGERFKQDKPPKPVLITKLDHVMVIAIDG